MSNKSRDVFLAEKKTLRERPRPLKALKNHINIQFPGIQGSVDIFWLLSDHLGNFIRQIQLKFGPDLIRGVPGLQKPAKNQEIGKGRPRSHRIEIESKMKSGQHKSNRVDRIKIGPTLWDPM